VNWESFIQSPEWREIVNTIRARKATIFTELGQPETTISLDQVRSLQAELATCIWLENLPQIIMDEVKGEGKEE
jgi:hypothetical protein